MSHHLLRGTDTPTGGTRVRRVAATHLNGRESDADSRERTLAGRAPERGRDLREEHLR